MLVVLTALVCILLSTVIGRAPASAATISSAAIPFHSSATWAMDGYNARRTHLNPYEHVLNTSNVSNLVLDWQYQTGNYINTSPAVANGILYIGSTDQNLYALDAQTGALKWSKTLGPALTSPAVVNGIVYTGSYNGKFYALDAQTGFEKWHFTTGGGITSAPVVANGVVYFGSLVTRMMYALDAQTGGELWGIYTGAGVGSSAAVGDGKVYVGLSSGAIVALDVKTGLEKWSYITPNAVGSELVAVDNYVFVPSGGELYVLNARTGKLMWQDTGSASFSVAVANGMVYVSLGNNTLSALNEQTGQVVWTYTAGSVILPAPTVANGVVYFCSSDGNLYALDAQSGMLKWSYAGDFAFSSATIARGVVYVGSYNGNVYAFHLQQR